MQEDASPRGVPPEPPQKVIASPDAGQRASDADREQAIALLRDATVDGRLTLEEFSERVEQALQARTHEALQVLGADLAGTVVPASFSEQPTHRWVVASRLERRGRWRLPVEYHVKVVCGTVVLDLSQAVVQAAVTTLHLRNFCGTVTVLVPEAVQVDIDDGGMFLTNEVTLPDRPPPTSAPLIRIRTSGVGGTNYIRAAQAPTAI